MTFDRGDPVVLGTIRGADAGREDRIAIPVGRPPGVTLGFRVAAEDPGNARGFRWSNPERCTVG